MENEALCLAIAHLSGMGSDPAEILDLYGPVLVVPRYDRLRHDDDVVVRLHQEDMCQALSIPVGFWGDAKCESDGGPAYRQIARVLDNYAHDSARQLEQLARMMTFNVAIGNADAHGKNVSLIHDTPDSVTLAPPYDVMCTAWYRDVATSAGRRPVSTTLAMYVHGVQDLHAVSFNDLVNEAVEWRLSERRARTVIKDFIETLDDAVARTAADFTGQAAGIATYIAQRVASLRSGGMAGGEAL